MPAQGNALGCDGGNFTSPEGAAENVMVKPPLQGL